LPSALPAEQCAEQKRVSADSSTRQSRLAQPGDNYQTVPFDKLDGLLADKNKRSKGELELFGAKIPNDLVAWLGIPALALLFKDFLAV
jgi:hypothetical protein